jgi:hypothetical protein
MFYVSGTPILYDGFSSSGSPWLRIFLQECRMILWVTGMHVIRASYCEFCHINREKQRDLARNNMYDEGGCGRHVQTRHGHRGQRHQGGAVWLRVAYRTVNGVFFYTSHLGTAVVSAHVRTHTNPTHTLVQQTLLPKSTTGVAHKTLQGWLG